VLDLPTVGRLRSPPTRFKENGMLKLKVPDMSCGHCAATIEKAVRSVDPAAKLAVDVGAQTVSVETGAAPATVREAIRSAGYETLLTF
jgi:copper chaperone CopZ